MNLKNDLLKLKNITKMISDHFSWILTLVLLKTRKPFQQKHKKKKNTTHNVERFVAKSWSITNGQKAIWVEKQLQIKKQKRHY